MAGSQFLSFPRGNRGKLKYLCNGCTGTPKGCNLKRHYKNNVNWPLVKLLKAAKGIELQELRDWATITSFFRLFFRLSRNATSKLCETSA